MFLLLCSSVVCITAISLLKRYLCIGIGDVDWKSKRHGGELVARVLSAAGVKYVFTLVGGHISPILVACESEGIRVIDTRHEATAVFAADAVARLTGTCGVAAVTAGPGLTNTITAVKNAQMAESPLLLIGGAAATVLKGRGALQDIDQMSLFKPICKHCATVSQIKDIPHAVRQAMAIAQSGVPGPVFLEFPIDTLYPIETVAEGYGVQDPSLPPKATNSKPKGLLSRFLLFHLTLHVKRLFAGAWSDHIYTPISHDVPIASSGDVAKAAAILRDSKKPVMLMGSQSTLPPVESHDLVDAVEKIGIPTYLGGMSRGLLGRKNKIHCCQKRRDALREADVIILAGSICDFRLDYGRLFNKKAKIIAINRSPEWLKKNSGTFWNAALYVKADVGCFIKSLADSVGTVPYPPDWLAHLKSADKVKEEANKKLAAEPPSLHMNPLMLLYDFEDVIDDNTILVADGGDFVGSAAYIVKQRGPKRWLDPGAFGTLGVGAGFALGAKLVHPDADVWVIYGDGSLGYSMSEFDTFARHKIPIIALVGNDACWTQIAREQVPMFKSSVACDLGFTDYHIVADGFNGQGYLLDDISKAPEVLNEVLEASRTSKKPQLINALIGKSKFREGSISV